MLWASTIISPKLLAFPHHAQVGAISVYSEAPITPHIKDIVARSQSLLRQSAIYSENYGKTIYLTDGGWRWSILAPTSRYAFALSRPLTETIVLNRSELATDRVFSPASNGRTRSLSGTIAHEQTHGLLLGYLGLTLLAAPTWKVEGYCDYIAQNGSLNDKEAVELAKTNPDHPALVYHYGRKRVAAILAKNGQSVSKMFDDR